jgi:CO/xanthine dehydrogenase Mo-binding subunit
MAFTLKVNGTAHSEVVNPDTIVAQVEGGALFCLTPAITNAIFAVTGKRIRTRPIDTRQLQS